jgi:hypothetical protein
MEEIALQGAAQFILFPNIIRMIESTKIGNLMAGDH